MNNGLRHFANQFGAACRSWPAVAAGVFAAGIVAVNLALSMEPDLVDRGMVVILLVQVGWVAALVGAGSVTNTARNMPAVGLPRGDGLAARPNPTIPVGHLIRVGSEALAGVAVLVAFQAVFLALAFAMTGRGALPAMRVQLLGGVAVLPMAAAWLLPARWKYIHLFRALAASLVGGLAVYKSVSMGSPAPALLVSLGLAVVLFATWEKVARVERRSHINAARTSRAAFTRRSRAPLIQLWHDTLTGPFAANGRAAWAAAGAALAGILLQPAKGNLRFAGTGLIDFAVFVTGFSLLATPLGLIKVGETSWRRGQDATGRDLLSSRAPLPVKREWVARAFYAHGLVAVTAFVGLGLAGARLTGWPVLTIGPSDYAGGCLLWLFVAPPFAGYLASAAAGNKRMSRVSLVVLGASWVAYFTVLMLNVGIPRGGPRLWLGGAIGLVFALAGGLPPLKYLFPTTASGHRLQATGHGPSHA